MFRIKTWIPIEVEAEEDVQYNTKEDAENEIAQLEEMQPENKYEIVEAERDFIHADRWRQLNADDIISSIDIGLSVLKEKEGFGKEHHGQLLVLIEDKETKKILDRLCADKMDMQEAAKALDMSVEEVFELADNYDYIPTSEEVIKACKIEQETISHIKFIALIPLIFLEVKTK